MPVEHAPWRRLKSCVEAWPECSSGEYNPACCRFPKSCSCLADPAEVDESLLEPAPPIARCPTLDAEWDGDSTTRPITPDLPDDVREAKAQLDAWAAEVRCDPPVPGPDIPTWTIDELRSAVAHHRQHGDLCRACSGRWPCVTAALLAEVDRRGRHVHELTEIALRHEHCGPAADTLRQALTDIVREARLLNTGRNDLLKLLRIARIASQALLVDGGGDG